MLLPAAAAAAAILSTTCDDATGPERRVPGAVAIAPNFGSLDLDVVQIAKGRFRLTRLPGGAVALDTIITIAPGQDSVSLALTVPMLTPGEQFSLFISLLSSEDDTLFQAGPLTVTPSTSGSPVPVPADFVYVGTGAKAAGVRIVTPDTSVFFGETLTVIGEAFDSSAVTIPNTPIGWTSLDTLVAQATTDASYRGIVMGSSQRGTARLVATLITGQTDTVLVRAQPVPSDLLAESGDGQTARADSVLAQPLVARVVGADALGIDGVWVHFSLTAGNGILSADSVRTGPDGRASVEYTMARSFAPHLIAATTARLPADTATFTAQLQSEPPDSIAIVAGNGQTATAGAPVAVAPQVRVLDANGQAVAGATVTFNVTGGGGIVAGGTPVTDTLGLAAVTSWTLGAATGANTLRAFVVEGLDTLAVTFTATGVAGPASQLVLVSGDAQIDTAGATLPLPLVVRAEDANGNAVSGAQVDWTADAGSLSNSTISTDPAGLALVTWTLGTTSGSQTATATLNGTTATVAFTSTATTGTAARLGFTVEPTDVRADSVITPAVAVTAFDTFDNVVTGFTGDVQLALLANPPGGTLSGTTTGAAVAGVATFADLRVDLFGNGYTLLASAIGLTPDTSAVFDVLPPAGVAYWANASGGNWSDPANWIGGVVPSTTDTVMIDLAGGYTITLDTTVTVARVLLGGGSNTPTLTYASRPFGTSDGLVIAAGATVQLSDGTLDGPGSVTVANGATLVSARSTINADLVNQGTLELQGNPQAMNGALTQSGTLRLTSDAFGNGGLLSMASGFSNTGAMELSGTNEARITITSGTLTNAPSGTITTLGAFQRTLAAPVDNQGTIDVPGSGGLELNAVSAQHTNSGTISLTGGNLAVTQSGTTPSFTHGAGTIDIGSGQTLAVSGGAFAFTGGTLQGRGTADLSGTSVTALDGAFSPGASPGLLTLNLPAGVALGTNADVTIELGADPTANPPGVDNDLLSVTNQLLGLGGTLDVTLINGYVPAGTETWPLLAGVSGSFAQVNLPPLDYSWTAYLRNDTLYLGPPPAVGPPGTEAIWQGDVDTNWGTAGNWDTGVVPDDTTNVFVPAGTSNAPTVTGTATVDSLVVEDGATLTLGSGATLTASGSVAAGATIDGAGTLVVTGAGNTVSGTIANLRTTDSITVDGPLTITGNLTAGGPGSAGSNVLNLNGFPVTVGGNLTVGPTGYGGIRMAAGDTLAVAGNALFAGGNTDTRLNAGVLLVGGDFSQSSYAQAYRPTGTHKLVLDGATAQTVTFGNPTTSIAQDVEITNTSGAVTFATNAEVNGPLTMLPGALPLVAGGATLTVRGDLPPGTAIAGTGTVRKEYAGSNLAGTYPNLETVDSITLSGPLSVTGTLTVTGPNSPSSPGGSNVLALNGFIASVTGDLVVGTGYGGVRMANGDTLLVTGNASFAGGNTTDRLNGGVLFVGGDFTQFNTPDGYAPTGTHKLILNGASAQTISLANPGSSVFHDLEIANVLGGVTLASAVQANGQLIVPGTGVALHGDGNALSVAGVDVDGLTLDSVPFTSTDGTITLFDNVTFDSYAPTTTQLTIVHPGAAAAFTFDGLTFNTTPTTGAYINATDDLADANALTIDLANTTPSDGLAFTTTAGGAVVNWVQPTPPNLNAWTGGAADGLWTSAGNWSKNAAPVPGDSVVIDLAGTYTVTIPSSEAPQVSQLFLGGVGANPTLEIVGFATLVVDDTAGVAAGATLQLDNTARFDGAAILSVEGTLTCPGGNCIMAGAGLTEIASGGTFVIDGTGGSGLSLETRNLVNRGTTNWQGGSAIASSGGATVLNASGGVFNVSTTSGATAPIVNQGTFVRAGNAFGTSFAGPFTTTGTVDIQNGALSFTAPTSWAGTVTVSSATAYALDLAARAHVFADGLSITGPVSVTNGSPFATSVTVPPGATVTLDAVDLIGGTLEVDGYADVNGSFSKGAPAVLQGIGTLDLADPTIPAFDGPINPGNSPGLLTMVTPAGGLSLAPTASVNIELAGTTRGSLYDALEVGGGLLLDGNATLNVDTTGFTPTVGDQYAVLTFASRSGTFGTLTLPTVAGVQLDTVWTSGQTPDTLYVVANAAAPPNLNSWTGSASDGLWSSAANWSKNAVPVPGDSVVIDLDGTYTVTVDVTTLVAQLFLGGPGATPLLDLAANSSLAIDDTAAVAAGATLQIDDLSTLTGAGTLTVDGAFNWGGGTMSGSGATVLNTGASVVFNGATKFLDSRTFVNDATIAWTAGNWFFDGTAAGTNQPGATIDMQGDLRMALSTGGTFLNLGTLVKSAGSGTGELSLPFTNNGSVEVQAGSLAVSSTGASLTHGGAFTGSAGTSLVLSNANPNTQTFDGPISGFAHLMLPNSSGTFTFNGAVSVSHIGIASVTGIVNGTLSGLDSVTIGGGGSTLQLTTGSTVSIPYLALGINAGGLSGSDDVSISDSLTWSYGGLTTSGTVTLESSAIARIVAVGVSKGASAPVVNNGTVFLSGSPMSFTGGITNTAGATFDIEDDVSITGPFVNQGTLTKSAGSGVATMSGLLQNDGIIDISSGTLGLSAGFAQSTAGTLQGTGTLDLSGATLTAFDGTVRPGTSPGQLTINGAPTLGANAAVEIELAGSTTPGTDFDQLRVTNGPLTLGGTLDVTLIDPYVPAGGESWPLLTGVTGSFATVSLPPGLVADTVTRNDTLFLDALASDPTNYWRFEGANFLLDSEGSADLTPAGTPVPAQVTLPATGRGSTFPDPVGAGVNSSAADFSGGSGSSRFTTTLPLTQRFTIEAFVHFDTFTGTYGKIIAGFGPANDSPWNFQVRLDGILGTTPRELILGGGNATTGQWAAGSGFILDPGIDYYVAAAFDIAGTVTFWIQDLTNGGPLQTSSTTHGLTVLPADTRFAIGENSGGTYDFEMDGLIDELRLSNRVLTQSELIVSTLPPPPPAILFAGDSAGDATNSGIFKVNGDGTSQTQITTDGPPVETNVHPRWSPDRTRITYTNRPVQGEPNDVYVRSADGQQSWIVVSDTSGSLPRYSPDGKHLAFACGDGGYPNSAQDVCVIPDITNPADNMGNGGGKVYVTDDVSTSLGGSGAFAWNPQNANQLAVVRDSAGAAVGSQIWLVNSDGSGATPLGTALIKDGAGALVQVYAMDWAPDGSFIVFEGTSGSTRSIFRIEVTTGVVTQLTSQNQDFMPVISPDGTGILFGRASSQWYLMNVSASGGSPVQMSPNMNFGFDQAGWDWSPDGTEIVLTEDYTTAGIVISKILPSTTATSFFSDAKAVGRRGGIEISDRQPSWRP